MFNIKKMSNLIDAAKQTLWTIYDQIATTFIRKYEFSARKEPNENNKKILANALMADMILTTYRKNPDSMQLLLGDPRIQKYFKVSQENLNEYVISILEDNNVPAEYIAAVIPHDTLVAHDVLDKTTYSEIDNLGEFERLRKNKQQLEAELDAYEAYAENNLRTSIPIDKPTGGKRPAINKGDDDVLNKKIRPKDPTPEDIQISEISSSDQENLNLEQLFTEDPTTTEPANMEVDSKNAGTTSLGHHGSYFGNTQRNASYERSRFEREVIKTHRRRDEVHYWGMSRFTTDFDGINEPSSGDVLNGAVKTGVQLFNVGFLNNSLQYPYNTAAECSMAPLVYGVPINFMVRDFIDFKTLTGTSGRLRQYEKISLAEIHVEIEIHTRKGSAFDNEWFLSRWSATTIASKETLRAAKKDLTWNPNYFIFRDANGEYAANGLIKPNPEYQSPGTEAKPSFKLASLVKKDRTSDIVSKAFSFTRKVTSGGPYYLTPDKIWSLRDTSISLLINEIEGQSADASGNLVKWPEYFNFIIAPLNADMVLAPALGTPTSALITPNFHTELHIKTSATWLAMQSSQTTDTVGRKIDPYYKANSMLNQETVSHYSVH